MINPYFGHAAINSKGYHLANIYRRYRLFFAYLGRTDRGRYVARYVRKKTGLDLHGGHDPLSSPVKYFVRFACYFQLVAWTMVDCAPLIDDTTHMILFMALMQLGS